MNFIWNLYEVYVNFLYEKEMKSNMYEFYVKILCDFDIIFMWILYDKNFVWYLCENVYFMFYCCFMWILCKYYVIFI